MRRFLTGRTSTRTHMEGVGASGRSRASTPRFRWLPSAALLAIALVVALVPASSFAANPAASLDQCANDPLPSSHLDGCATSATQWVNGNLGASKSVYFEGDSIPYRLTLSNLSTSAIHHVTIEWDTTKSSKHAIDYIDTVNQSVADANPCLGVSGCNGTFSSGTILADPQVTGAGVTPIAGTVRVYGGNAVTVTRPSAVGNTPCTNANSNGAYCYSTGTGFTGDKSAAVTINFTASVANPVVAWGGHIATRANWGLTNSAVSISGSPYHTRLIDLDGAGGNQDRSLSADAVIFPGFIHVIKNTTGGDGTFGYTASPSPLANCSITTVNGTGGGSDAEHCFFDNITNFQTYTINETSIPANWAFDSASCVAASPNGGSATSSSTTATINMKEGEEWTCTYANHHTTNTTSIATTLSETSGSIGDSVTDSSKLSGNTATAGGDVQYTVYTDSACSKNAVDLGDKTVTNGVVPDSNAFTPTAAGDYYFQAVYSGDANNKGATSTCTDEHLVITNPQVSQITPTQTTCQQFASGQSSTLSQVQYSVKGNAISQVAPGVFFYWVKVSAPGTYTINQSITTANFTTLFAVAAGSSVFNSACNTVAGNTITQSSGLGAVTVTFSSASSGPFYIGIKFSTSNVVGKTAPPSNNSTVHYQYSTTGVAGSTSGLDLVRKK
jgi:hypothetical protein